MSDGAQDLESVVGELMRDNKALRSENEKLRAAIRENDQNFMCVDKERMKLRAKLQAATGELCDSAAAAALKEPPE